MTFYFQCLFFYAKLSKIQIMQNQVLIFCFLLLCVFKMNSQNGVQLIKGNVIDAQSELPLIGATINLISESENIYAVTDIDGSFKIPNVPISRRAFAVSYLGYENIIIPNIEVSAGKQIYLNIKMDESLNQFDEIVIKGNTEKDRSINDMATVSSRQFSMEEVNRFSGGRSDVGRLAGNFAGVSTADDSRNDIVIRGNSPTGLLWQLEGIPIPSPNHFSTVGTTGGPVSALNPNLLKNSDFFTSAFPAEYGNALSGVFDLGFRNGNKDKVEYTLQMGVITGFEGMIEGPLNKRNNGSFIIAGRYAFTGVAQSMGLDIGTNAVPNYQDLSFKFDFGKTQIGRFTLFGVGGKSDIAFLADEVDETDLFSADDEDAFADSKFGVVGLKHNLILDNQAYIKTVIGISGNSVQFMRERYYNIDTEAEIKRPFVTGDNALSRYSFSSYYNNKYNSHFTIRAGVLFESIGSNLFFESAEFGNDFNNDGIFDLEEVYKFNARTLLLQPFIQAQIRLNNAWTINAGLRQMYYDLNDKSVLDPRAAISWQLAAKHKLSLGYGMHHQAQPIPIQIASFQNNGMTTYPNRSLDYSKSNQLVLGYDFKINESWRSKLEVYYQNISNVPVEKESSSFSVLNVGADFGFPIDKNNLISEGTGTNKGIELTIEKFFNQGYYVLLTASFFDSKYKGSDGIERNTAFNNQRVVNFLAGKEFKCGKQKQHRFTFDTKVTTAGGRFYTPIDLKSSQINEIEVFDESQAFQEQYSSYFRWDMKVGVKLNSTKKKFSQAFYFDIQNVTNNDNIFSKSYNRLTNEVNDIFQIGFFPNFMYKVEF